MSGQVSVARRHAAAGARVPAAFTLVELLVVVAIISLLVTILMPSLGRALYLTRVAICGVNQRNVYLAAVQYGGDYDGWLGPKRIVYYHPSYNPDIEETVPEQLVNKGLANPYSSVPNHYLGLGYLDLTTSNYQGVPGNDVLICPVATSTLGKIYKRFSGNHGDVECHFFFSHLMFQRRDRYVNDDPTQYRNNVYGPYKVEELDQPGMTFFAGDAQAFRVRESIPGYNSDYAMSAGYTYGNVGERSTCFGAMVYWGTLWYEDPPHYHDSGPNAVHWDGHVEVIPIPPADPQHRFDLRRHFTRDGTPNYH